MLTPLLTEEDPAVSGEGTLDPLGLYAIADALAVRLVPGVRERQKHPRFLTATAVSLTVCSEFDEDMIAADRVSEPWQVFEWYLVEGLVRATEDSDHLRGLPGRDKAARAIRDRVPLSAARYLKTPSTFGFNGVYRLLGRNLGIEAGGRLGERGFELVNVWAREQRLDGFCGTVGGPGQGMYQRLKSAVQDGLKEGAVARKGGWSGWKFFADHLSPYGAGRSEVKLIRRALLDGAEGFRRPVLEFLLSTEGRIAWEENDDGSERRFHERLARRCDDSLRELLHAIDIYERFARLMQDAFDDCLCAMSASGGRTRLTEFASLEGVVQAADQVPKLYEDLIEALMPFGQMVRFRESFTSVAERLPAREWAARLLEHHRAIQHGKPPNGKAPWFEQFDTGEYVIRPAYRRETGGRHDDSYQHAYRTSSLWSFTQDLGLVS